MILEIKDPVLLNKENCLPEGNKDATLHKIKYVLQCWRDDGKMIYERRLGKLLKGWSMANHMFIFQENDEEDAEFEIYCLTNSI